MIQSTDAARRIAAMNMGHAGMTAPAVQPSFAGLAEANQRSSWAQTFAQVLAQQSGTGSTIDVPSQTANTPDVSVAAAEWWVTQLMQSLPVPGLDTANDLNTFDESTPGATPDLAGLLTDALLLQSPDVPGLLPSLTAASPAATGTGALSSAYLPSSAAGDTTGADTAGAIRTAVEAASQKYNLPAPLIRAVIQAESGMQANAVSPAGAMGLMQLMPDTARELGVTNPFDPAQNIDAGSRYLSNLLQQFGGRLDLALAAYNAGPGAVISHKGIPPYPETQSYVQRVLMYANQFAQDGSW